MAKAKKPKGRAARSRRGKGEDMTGAKGAQVEVRTGSLIPEMDLSDKDINHHFNSIKRATEAKDSAVSALRTAMKKAEETQAGLGAEIATQIREEKKPDQSALAEKLSLKARVMKARGGALQINIFDTTAGDQMEMIYRRFYKAGKDGQGLDNRYPAGSDLALQAERAWRHGSAANMSPPVSPEQADAALEDEELLGRLSKLPPPPDMAAQASVH